MKLPYALARRIPHKYAIDSKQLGDEGVLAWSNLGFWENTQDYVTACRQLADHLAQAVSLSSTDRLLDLGCGQGASLQHWYNVYHVQHLSAVEIQPGHVEHIRQQLLQLQRIDQDSFLNLNHLYAPESFDVVLCIDAAYHADLHLFLKAVQVVLKPQGRLGFHYLMLSEKWQQLAWWQKQKYYYLLKGADVNQTGLYQRDMMFRQLQQQGYDQIEIMDISQPVFAGFADYIASRPQMDKLDMAQAKIYLTAKLCRYLYKEGIIRYVQVNAVKV